MAGGFDSGLGLVLCSHTNTIGMVVVLCAASIEYIFVTPLTPSTAIVAIAEINDPGFLSLLVTGLEGFIAARVTFWLFSF